MVGQVFAMFVLTVAAGEAAIGCHPRHLLPRPRHIAGRRHQPDEGAEVIL
jgi:hypothetical protein